MLLIEEWYAMLPDRHFLVASLIILSFILILYPEKSLIEIGEWILIGGVISSAIDLDVIALVFLKSKEEYRLKPFRNLLLIYQKFDLFMDTIIKTGILRTVIKTHLISSCLILLLFYFFSNIYFIPVMLGVISHLVSDIPNLLKVT